MREYGFRGSFNDALGDFRISLSYGAKHLKNYLKRYPNESDVIASYNAGSPRKTKGGMYENQTYVDKVYKELLALRKLST
jgi:soluble lytic murein transglycosylase-like protein